MTKWEHLDLIWSISIIDLFYLIYRNFTTRKMFCFPRIVILEYEAKTAVSVSFSHLSSPQIYSFNFQMWYFLSLVHASTFTFQSECFVVLVTQLLIRLVHIVPYSQCFYNTYLHQTLHATDLEIINYPSINSCFLITNNNISFQASVLLMTNFFLLRSFHLKSYSIFPFHFQRVYTNKYFLVFR